MVSTRALSHQSMPATPDKEEAPPAQANNGGGMASEMETEEEERTLSIHRCRCVRPSGERLRGRLPANRLTTKWEATHAMLFNPVHNYAPSALTIRLFFRFLDWEPRAVLAMAASASGNLLAVARESGNVEVRLRALEQW